MEAKRPVATRHLVAVLWAGLLVAATQSPAQDPEMAGTWRLDVEASDERRNGPPLVETTLTVALEGDDVVVARDFGGGRGPAQRHEVTYVTDGKPHEISGIVVPTREVRARWRKKKLQISYALERGPMVLDVTEVWSLTKQGDLQILFSTRVGDRNLTRKEMYRRS